MPTAAPMDRAATGRSARAISADIATTIMIVAPKTHSGTSHHHGPPDLYAGAVTDITHTAGQTGQQ